MDLWQWIGIAAIAGILILAVAIDIVRVNNGGWKSKRYRGGKS